MNILKRLFYKPSYKLFCKLFYKLFDRRKKRDTPYYEGRRSADVHDLREYAKKDQAISNPRQKINQYRAFPDEGGE